MIRYLFPYEMVPYGADVIIYGFGKAGREFFAQIQYTQYCNVKAILDMKADSLQNSMVDICIPTREYLKKVKYDYIIISLVSEMPAASVKRTLIEMGVPKNKIVMPIRYEVMGLQYNRSEYNSILEKPSLIRNCLKEFALYGSGMNYFFFKIMEGFREEDDARVKRWLDEVQELGLSNEEMVIVLHVIFGAGKLDPERFKELMHRVVKLHAENNAIFDTGMFLTYVTLSYPYMMYDGFYADWKVYLKRVAEEYALKLTTINRKNHSRLKRIAICKITPIVRCKNDGYTTIVQSIANGLCGLGYEVALMPNELLVPYDEEGFLIPFSHSNPMNDFVDVESDGINKEVKIFYRHERSVKERMQGLINDVCDYNPDIIIDVMDEFSPHSYVLKDAFPIIYIPARGGGSGSYFYKYITSDKQKSEEFDIIHKTGNSGKFVELRSTGVPVYNKSNCYTRSEFGFSEDDFIIVTVGSRLGLEVDDRLGLCMKQFLEKNPNAVWLLVGSEPGFDSSLYKDLIARKQIIWWGEEEELASLYKLCNVYLNPDRIGGGVSIRSAMQYGLVIVMLNKQSDALYAVGSENAVNGGYEEMMSYLENLIKDPDLLNHMSTVMKERIEKLDNRFEFMQKFARICEETMQNYYEERSV